MMSKLENKLNTIDACQKAIDWASTQKGSFQKSWDKCPRADWLLWLLGRSKSDRKKIVLASCKIARTVLKYVPDGEERPLVAIQTTEAWVEGKATLEEVKESAHAAADADAADAAEAACNAAAHAAYSAYSAAAAHAADSAAYYAANAATNREESLLNSAKIVREFFPKPPLF